MPLTGNLKGQNGDMPPIESDSFPTETNVNDWKTNPNATKVLSKKAVAEILIFLGFFRNQTIQKALPNPSQVGNASFIVPEIISAVITYFENLYCENVSALTGNFDDLIAGVLEVQHIIGAKNLSIGNNNSGGQDKLRIEASDFVRQSIVSTNSQANLFLQGLFAQIENSVGNLFITNNDTLGGAMIFRTNGGYNRMFIAGDGKIGIGNSNPLSLLHVGGNGKLGEANGLTIGEQNELNAFFATILVENSGYGLLKINVRKNGINWGNVIFNEYGGCVGIGTNNPYSKLHVNANSLADCLITVGNTHGGTIFGHTSNNEGIISAYNATNILFGCNQSTVFVETMRLQPNGSVSIGCSVIESSVLLKLESPEKGFLLPRLTTIQINAIASPVEGLQVYNITLHTICFFNGTSWQKVTSSTM